MNAPRKTPKVARDGRGKSPKSGAKAFLGAKGTSLFVVDTSMEGFSKGKRLKKVGFRTRSKTAGGRKVIKRKIKRSGKFRVG